MMIIAVIVLLFHGSIKLCNGMDAAPDAATTYDFS
jgi:hypothetical protein